VSARVLVAPGREESNSFSDFPSTGAEGDFVAFEASASPIHPYPGNAAGNRSSGESGSTGYYHGSQKSLT
jgi:hypothetical protein